MPQSLTVFFSDIANSTRLYQSHGDVVAHKLITDCLAAISRTVEQHRGVLLRTVGDAVLASFDEPDDALDASVELQRLQTQSPLTIRIGFHTGEVIPDAGDVYGNAVNIAARVAGFANAGEIFTTEDSIRQISPHRRRHTTFLDRIAFKGISHPMPVYRVQWTEDSTSQPGADTRIVTAVSRDEKAASNLSLDLLVGARRLRIDKHRTQVSIGRDISNDIVIQHESTSRRHAVIELHRDRYTITDSSTNGTYIVRSGVSPVFIRRESIVLDHHGDIGAGWAPESRDKDRIGFRTVRHSSTTSV